MSFQFLFSGATLCAVVLSLSACSKPAVTEEPVRAVKVIAVGTEAMQSGSEYAGEVRARVESRLGFRVGGKIVRRQAELGQRVKVGDVLAQLDAQDLKLASEAARAQLNAASTNRDLAAADFKRFKDLRDQNFISAAELERREASLKAAQAQVDQAQAQFSGQGNQASYASLVADTAGVVTSVDAEVGQVVGAGTPVVRIAQDGPRDVVFSVPEDKILKIKVGSDVSIRAWSNPAVFKGTVREVAASADPVTRTFSVKVTMQAADALPNAAPKWPLNDGRVKISAAWLIENAGMHKGDEVGGARISTKHVLALTNAGDATAADIAELAKRARNQVKEIFGITLEAEVNLIGIEI